MKWKKNVFCRRRREKWEKAIFISFGEWEKRLKTRALFYFFHFALQKALRRFQFQFHCHSNFYHFSWAFPSLLWIFISISHLKFACTRNTFDKKCNKSKWSGNEWKVPAKINGKIAFETRKFCFRKETFLRLFNFMPRLAVKIY